MEGIDITYRELQAADADQLAALYEEVFRKKESPAYFITKYGLLLDGVEVHSGVAECNGEIIGLLGGLPQLWTKDGAVKKVVHVCDYILKEQYRGKGIFQELYTFVIKRAKENGVSLFYAFQSDQTYKVCQRLGWKDAPALERFEITPYPTLQGKIARKLQLVRWSSFINDFEKVEDIFRLHLNSSGEWKNTYDLNFFRMKEYHQRVVVDIEGTLVWMKFDYRITVGYIQFCDNANVELVLARLKRAARKARIHQLVFHIDSRSDTAALLREHLSPLKSYSVSYFPLENEGKEFLDFRFHYMDGDMF